MGLETVALYFLGLIISLIITSPAEWAVHKYLMHVPKGKRKWYSNKPSIGHQDTHHMGYIGPAHYYRDSTNEHVTVHFHSRYVIIIAAISIGVAAVLNVTLRFFRDNSTFGWGDGAFIVGFLTGTMMYYAAYEFSHHYMHVIGKRRLRINKVLGDTLQDKPDGNLRLPKPLLDDICHAVENHVDRYVLKKRPERFEFGHLVILLETIVKMNRTGEGVRNIPFLTVRPPFGQKTLDKITATMVVQEKKLRASFSSVKKLLYGFERRLLKTLRTSRMFQSLDNHHFVHHYRFSRNLNVVWPAMDRLMRTKLPSSRNILIDNKTWWLCPNSPDVKPFTVPV